MTRLRWLLLLFGLALGAWVVLWLIAESYAEPPNYTQVENGLYVGGHVDRPPRGVTAVLNLCEIEDPYKCDDHAWRPIRDAAPAPPIQWLTEQVDFIDVQRKAGRTVYVHCVAGVSRGPMVTAAYLMSRHRWTRDEAIAYLRERRPQVRPNPAFMDLLSEWERHLTASQ